MDTEALVQQLAAGFEALQEEYQKLFGQHEALERKLATARDQVRTTSHCHDIALPMMKHQLALDL